MKHVRIELKHYIILFINYDDIIYIGSSSFNFLFLDLLVPKP